MQAVVGVVRTHSDALRIVEALRRIDVPDQHISVLSPNTPESALQAVPKTDAEQPGIGGTIGGVVGGAAGTAGGLTVAALALPGVGPIIAAGAIALGSARRRRGEHRRPTGSTRRSPRACRPTSCTCTETRCGGAAA